MYCRSNRWWLLTDLCKNFMVICAYRNLHYFRLQIFHIRNFCATKFFAKFHLNEIFLTTEFFASALMQTQMQDGREATKTFVVKNIQVKYFRPF